MFIQDTDYRKAVTHMFATTFFDTALPYKNSYRKHTPPIYLTAYTGTGKNIKQDYYRTYFYNQKINIDYQNTILVKEDGGVITYNFYENTNENDRLYVDVYVDLGNNKKIHAGTKFREVIS